LKESFWIWDSCHLEDCLYYKANQNTTFKSRESLEKGFGTPGDGDGVIRRGLGGTNRRVGRKGTFTIRKLKVLD
jgi:hypothetical protein